MLRGAVDPVLAVAGDCPVADPRAAVVLTVWAVAAMSLGTCAFLRRDA